LIGLPKYLHCNGTELRVKRLKKSRDCQLHLGEPQGSLKYQGLAPVAEEKLGALRNLVSPAAKQLELDRQLEELIFR
jgi:hypothetical protein